MSNAVNLGQQRVMLVTGGASGIGAATAQLMAGSGWHVVVADMNQAVGQDFADSIGAVFVRADLGEQSQCKQLVEAVVNAHGRIDAIVNNAGFQHVCALADFPEDKWNSMISVMLTAPFLLTRYAWPYMQEQRWGRVVNMASIHSKIASLNKAAYITAKHGLIGLTRAAALEGGEYGITVNAISPAYVRTPLVEGQIADQANVYGISEEEVLDNVFFKNSAVKRLIEPREVADVVQLLCSDQGASISGANWTIDGGWTAQ